MLKHQIYCNFYYSCYSCTVACMLSISFGMLSRSLALSESWTLIVNRRSSIIQRLCFLLFRLIFKITEFASDLSLKYCQLVCRPLQTQTKTLLHWLNHSLISLIINNKKWMFKFLPRIRLRQAKLSEVSPECVSWIWPTKKLTFVNTSAAYVSNEEISLVQAKCRINLTSQMQHGSQTTPMKIFAGKYYKDLTIMAL